VAISVDLSPELHEAVRVIAAERGTSVAELLVVAVDELVRRRDRIDELSKRIVREDEELLGRLA
jgi:hypothetical protein